MVLFCKRGRVRGSKRLHPNLQTPVCLGLTRSTHTCKWSNQTYNKYRSAISILSSVKRSEQRSESHGNLAAKNRRQMCHADEFGVEIWDNVLSAESQNSLNFGSFSLIVLVSACFFSFTFGYSSLLIATILWSCSHAGYENMACQTMSHQTQPPELETWNIFLSHLSFSTVEAKQQYQLPGRLHQSHFQESRLKE